MRRLIEGEQYGSRDVRRGQRLGDVLHHLHRLLEVAMQVRAHDTIA